MSKQAFINHLMQAEVSPPCGQIQAGPTQGKSRFLFEVAEELRRRGRWPVMISPSPGAPDGGPKALMQLCVGLAEVTEMDAAFDELRDPAVAWSAKLRTVQRQLKAQESRVVLLCDEPESWIPRGQDDEHFARYTEDVYALLFQGSGCPTAVAGALPPGFRPTNVHHLEIKGTGDAWFGDRARWGSLADAAWVVGKRPPRGLSRLELRLLIAYTFVENDSAPTWLRTAHSRRELASRLADALKRRPDFQGLLQAWGRLALVRGPIHDELLHALLPDGLPPTADQILKKCLLIRRDGEWILHDLLRQDAVHAQLVDAVEARRAHETIARYFRDRFVGRTERERLLASVDEIEAYHHACQARSDALLGELSPFFSAQLDAWGRMRSQDGAYEQAVAAFRQSCNWDPCNHYAHHYWAYNLDVEGREPAEVAEHYQRAIELDARNVWWRTRWITFLVTRAKVREAREAWDQALDALAPASGEADPALYEHLHRWVARLLLHRGQLPLMADVLADVPEHVFATVPHLTALRRRLAAMVEIRAHRAVVPLTLDREAWWKGPHRCAHRNDANRPLVRWLPGRVDAVQEGTIDVRTAFPPPNPSDEATYGHLELTFDEFDRWCKDDVHARALTPGRFIELGYYEDVEEPVIRVHPVEALDDSALPWLRPDPARYLRRAGRVRTH